MGCVMQVDLFGGEAIIGTDSIETRRWIAATPPEQRSLYRIDYDAAWQWRLRA